MIFYLTAPVLVAQGRRVRASIPHLPEASGPVTGSVAADGTPCEPGEGGPMAGTVSGDGTPCRPEAGGPAGNATPLRIAVVGDSTGAGVGAVRHGEALPGFLAAEVAARTGRAVAWSVHARTGFRTSGVRRELLGGLLAAAPDVVVAAIGVNDLLAACPLGRFERDVAELAAGIRTAVGAEIPVVLSGMPPLGRFPSLPQPMRAILGWRARAMDRRLARVARYLPEVVHCPFDLPADLDGFFGADGFHPGPAGYRLWARQCAPLVLDLAAAA